MKEWYFWSNSRNELMLSLYTIRSECSCKYWFFYSVLYHKTFKLVDSSQTGLQWRISLGLSFVLQSYNLTSLLKHNFIPTFLHKFEMCSSKDNVLSICNPKSFCLLDFQIISCHHYKQCSYKGLKGIAMFIFMFILI